MKTDGLLLSPVAVGVVMSFWKIGCKAVDAGQISPRYYSDVADQLTANWEYMYEIWVLPPSS